MAADAAVSATEPNDQLVAAGPAAAHEKLIRRLAGRLSTTVLLVLVILAGLPVAVWLDMRNLSEQALLDQADDLTSMINNIRNYYATNVVERVLAGGERTQVLPNYSAVPGAIPIPATLSLELGDVINRENGNVRFRFFSDHPFKNRAPHAFDAFEREALETLRQDPSARLHRASGSIFDRRIQLITPIIMTAGCVNCHNSHVDSPKQDWKVGEVRGIEEISVSQPIAARIFAFKYLLIYFASVAAIGLAFIALQRYQSALIAQFNGELEKANAFLTNVAKKIARYLPPQLYRGILSGQMDVTIATERKKLTIFFSDVVSFSSITERMQPEELTALLNEYLTEMSSIATAHGGTINKFIGDAIVIFFGHPETRGIAEDAKACLAMAFEMQRRLAELNTQWRGHGIEEPFRARMGINTGFCNVGNFGSNERMDYTIIGAEVNLTARLQSIAQPGGIVLSYETFTLVRGVVRAHPLEPVRLKGIAHPVVPYAVDGTLAEANGGTKVISEHSTGLDLFINPSTMDAASRQRACELLEGALAELRARA